MNKCILAIGAAFTMTAVGLASATGAVAAPSGGGSATDVVNELRAQGYRVNLNGTRGGPLANCSVERIRESSGSAAINTVFVDLSCPAEYTND
ncbi:hypothetical protein [Mycobacterium neglectum]|uniref:hypothetical protein n=1 Tax=Mycobacterium neglectum TaxID=242737 RepID=UPI000BFEF61E|nr:hypothetical protein [Mycobacterium neglectum]